jgi:hypothetical protein
MPIETSAQSDIKCAGVARVAKHVIFGGLIGAGVDAAKAAKTDLGPKRLRLTLVPAQTGCTTPQAPELVIGGIAANNILRKL